MKLVRFFGACAALVLLGGWGATGHRIINGEATRHLPPSMLAFSLQKAWLADSASVADWRRSGSNGYVAVPSDAPKHYLDVDDYPEYATRSVQTDLALLIAQYGSTRVTDNGTLPWAIRDAVDTLTSALRRRDLRKVWSTASDLGHFVADGHNPLHCTVDFNGRATLAGSSGIHSRYETSMVNRYASSLVIADDSVQYVASPINFAMSFIYDSQALVDTLYAADVAARASSGWSGSGSMPTAYLDALWSSTGSLTQKQFQAASKALADLLYTAWVDAGRPDLSTVASVSREDLLQPAYELLPPYPNPFNPSTNVAFVLTRSERIRLELVGIDGRTVAVLAEGTVSPGTHRISLGAVSLSLASGMYLVRLSGADGARPSVRKILLIR